MYWVEPTESYFIKLGDNSRHAVDCFERGVIRAGFRQVPHEPCLAGDWDAVRFHCLIDRKGDEREASQDIRELKALYGSGESTLWTTFYQGHLYWCFTRGTLYEVPSPDGDYRRTLDTFDGWHYMDVKGQPLHEAQLSGLLTKTKGYRRTLCSYEPMAARYLAAKIQGEHLPEVVSAQEQQEYLKRAIARLIRMLTPQDFELLVDLCLARSGWRRISRVGGTQKDVDLVLEEPILRQTAMVQVKSTADFPLLLDYIERFDVHAYDKLFFVWHSGGLQASLATLQLGERADSVQLLDCDRLAELALETGLARWVINRLA